MLPLINQNIFTILRVVPGVPTSFRKAKKFVKSCYCKAQQISLQFDEFFKDLFSHCDLAIWVNVLKKLQCSKVILFIDFETLCKIAN